MNQAQRKLIADIAERLEAIKSEVETLRDEEQDKFDNMPDSLQGSEKGERFQAHIDSLASAFDSLEEAANSLQEID